MFGATAEKHSAGLYHDQQAKTTTTTTERSFVLRVFVQKNAYNVERVRTAGRMGGGAVGL